MLFLSYIVFHPNKLIEMYFFNWITNSNQIIILKSPYNAKEMIHY